MELRGLSQGNMLEIRIQCRYVEHFRNDIALFLCVFQPEGMETRPISAYRYYHWSFNGSFESVVDHSAQSHIGESLKKRQLILDPSTGKFKYQTLNKKFWCTSDWGTAIKEKFTCDPFNENIIIIIIIIITLFQEDNIFVTNASLIYDSQIQRHACVTLIITKQWKLLTVCTEQVRSPYIERAASGLPNRTRLEGEVRFIQAQDQQVLPHAFR